MRCKVAPGHRIYWQGRDRVEGEIIDLPGKEARLNIALKRCVNAEADRPLRVADPQPASRAPAVEQQASLLAEGEGHKPRRRRTYLRSDMQSED